MKSSSVEAAPTLVAPKKQATEKKVPSHPPASEMVTEAIAALKDRKGSSLQAIKTYIGITYKVDIDRQAVFIRKYIKAAVERKELIQTSGSGAMGKFKLADKKNSTTETKKKTQKPKEKKKAEIKEKVAKKVKAEKTEKKEKKEKKEKAEKVEKNVKATKEKKTGKALATKTKPPKPKKTTTSTTKKTAAKEK